MKLRVTPQLIVKILFLLSVCTCVLNILKLYSIVSFLYVLIFPLVLVLFIVVLYTDKYRKMDFIIAVSISAIALINSMIDILLFSQGSSLFDLKKTFIFIMTIMFLFAANQIKLDQKTITFVEKTIILSSSIIIALYFLKHNEIYLYNNLRVKFLYFNFTNPNFASMYLLLYGIYNFIFALKYKKPIHKLLCVCLAVFMFFAVWETLSRNAILITIFFLVIYSLIRIRKQLSLMFNAIVSLFACIWPLLFSALYMSFIQLSGKFNILSFLDHEKGFDTRVEVWTNSLEKIFKSPILGDFSFSVIRQSHNSHLDIWVSYGIIVLFLTCLFLFIIVYNAGQRYANRTSYLYMLGFICCIFIGMAEAALFSGCQGFFIMVGVLVSLSKSENA